MACPDGTRPKAGQPDYFFFDPIALPTPFSNLSGWLTSWALHLPSAPVRSSDFCSSEPTGPLPTTADWLLLADPPLALATGAYDRLGNFVQQQQFSDRCECSPATGSGCSFREFPIAWDARSPANSICGATTWYVDGSQGQLNFPAQQHHARVSTPGFTVTHDVQFDLYTSSIAERCFLWTAGTQLDVAFNANATDTFLGIAFRDASLPSLLQGRTLRIDFANLSSEPPCVPAGTNIPPPTPEPPPTNFPGPPTLACSTIADVCAAILQLQRHVEAVKNQVDVLQRWGEPFAYIEGSTYAGLTSAGQQQISRLLGLSVYVIDPPPGKPVLPGNPPYPCDVGWMSINDANGMLEEKRITRSGFDWFPRTMAMATSFNLSLNPGVVITAIERRPEA